MELKKKKAVLGLDTAKLFVLAILALVIISVVSLIILDSIGKVNDTTQFGGSLVNITTSTVVNESGALVEGLPADKRDCVLTITEIWGNATINTGKRLNSANYSVSGCRIIGTSTSHNNTLWNFTGTFTNSSDERVIVYNTTDALSSFFSEVGTWFTLIGVIIIIMIIAIVIVVINRFGAGGMSNQFDLGNESNKFI